MPGDRAQITDIARNSLHILDHWDAELGRVGLIAAALAKATQPHGNACRIVDPTLFRWAAAQARAMYPEVTPS